jgi:hypothetical protein
LQSDPRFTDAFKGEQIAELRQRQSGEAFTTSKSAWTAAQALLAEVDAELTATAKADDAKVNWQRVTALTDDLRSQLAAPPVSASIGADSRLAVLERAEQRARLSGDDDALRAIRTAGREALGEIRARMEGADAERAGALLTRLEADEKAQSAAIGALESERSYLTTFALPDLAAEMRSLESSLTGQTGGLWSVSTWSRDILGESFEAHGGGVHFRDKNVGQAVAAGDR